MPATDRIRFHGHSTVELELSGHTLITDPFLRRRAGPVVRSTPPIDPSTLAPDAVLISHLDRDHFDLPSLHGLSGSPTLVVPSGAGSFAREHGFESIVELAVGESAEVAGLGIAAVKAVHDGRRKPFGHRAEAVGYVVTGDRRVYFAGDTDLFDEMGDLATGLDVALLPVAGWGLTVGEGHLDPERAARAVELMRPRVVVPIHWGALHPVGLSRFMARRLTDPPHDLARRTAHLAPEVEVKVLNPGEELDL